MSLRDGAIQAINEAQARYLLCDGWTGRGEATAGLDALLDYLEERGYELLHTVPMQGQGTAGLVGMSVLREDTE